MSIITRGLKGNIISRGFRSILARAKKLISGIAYFHKRIETAFKKTFLRFDVDEARSKISTTKFFANAENIDSEREHAKIDMIVKIHSRISEGNDELL